ncbi:MAG: hypothetical protein V4436_02035 [Patescibacteria group bacterium]
MKLALLTREEGFMLVYQHGVNPEIGSDMVVQGKTVVECLEKLTAWYKEKYEQGTNI